jgi:hypothetical protein
MVETASARQSTYYKGAISTSATEADGISALRAEI